jgi:sugar/nucleoside kinase (ribokinase family)
MQLPNDSATPQRPQHLPGFRIATADKTGCGDVFHDAYAAALARGLSLGERVRFAAAAATIKAMRPGALAGAPLSLKSKLSCVSIAPPSKGWHCQRPMP